MSRRGFKIMKQYHVIKNDEQLGPFSEDHLKEQLSNGELSFNDICWAEGMEEWQPIHATIELPEMAAPPPAPVTPPPPTPVTPPPPPTPVTPPPPPVMSQQPDKQEPIGWIAALVAMSVVAVLSILLSFFYLAEEAIGWSFVRPMLLLSVPFLIAAAVFCSILHYKCWAAVPQQYRCTTPARAIGFLFIPFYNFYWAFITWPKLVDGLVSAGFKLPSSARHLAIVNAVVFVCSMTIGLIPGFDLLATIAQLVIFILLYRQLVAAINGVDGSVYKMV